MSRAWGLRGRLQKSSQGGREQIREGPRSHVKEFGLFIQRAVGNTAPAKVVLVMLWSGLRFGGSPSFCGLDDEPRWKRLEAGRPGQKLAE